MKSREKWIPTHVTRGKSAWEYRPVRGGKCVRLCALDASKSLVLKRHAEEFERHHTKVGTFKALVETFFDSPQFSKLAPQTQIDYRKYWKKLNPVFGAVDAQKITTVHIRKYMDRKGKTSEHQANRHQSFMSKVFSWGFERGHVNLNPCRGVVRFSEKPRDKYIEDDEYAAVIQHAGVAVRVAMEISYLCGARQGDVLRLKKSDLWDDGIYICQGKTGKKQVKKWTPQLRAAVALANTIKTSNGSTFVIPTRTGTGYTSDGFRAMFTKARAKARLETKKALNFTFHDIKAKGISDFEGDKQKFSGHKTPGQVAVYDRKIEVVDTLKK